MSRLIYSLVLGFCLSQLGAQGKPVEDTEIPYTIKDRDLARDMLMTMKMGFESMDKKIEALEKQIEANRVALEKQIQTTEKNLNKRLDFQQSLLITGIGILITFILGAGSYIIYVQNQERKLARTKVKLKASDGTISVQDFQEIIQRLAKLEQEITTLKKPHI